VRRLWAAVVAWWSRRTADLDLGVLPDDGRAQQIVDMFGDWKLTITDDQPVADGKTVPGEVHVALYKGCELRKEFLYPAYRQWTLLAHWKDSLS
jgi:hypothetical protein